MFIDTSGSVGNEHARDLLRSAGAHRTARLARTSPNAFRHWLARTHLGPVDNYRVR